MKSAAVPTLAALAALASACLDRDPACQQVFYDHSVSLPAAVYDHDRLAVVWNVGWDRTQLLISDLVRQTESRREIPNTRSNPPEAIAVGTRSALTLTEELVPCDPCSDPRVVSITVQLAPDTGDVGPVQLVTEAAILGGAGRIRGFEQASIVFDGVAYQVLWIEATPLAPDPWMVRVRPIDEDGTLGTARDVFAFAAANRPQLFARRVADSRRVVVVAAEWSSEVVAGAVDAGVPTQSLVGVDAVDADCDPIDRVVGAALQPRAGGGTDLRVFFCGSATVPTIGFRIDADLSTSWTRLDLPVKASSVFAAEPDAVVVQTGVVLAGWDDTPTAARVHDDGSVETFVVPNHNTIDHNDPQWLRYQDELIRVVHRTLGDPSDPPLSELAPTAIDLEEFDGTTVTPLRRLDQDADPRDSHGEPCTAEAGS